MAPASCLTSVPEMQHHSMFQVKRPEWPLFNPGCLSSWSQYFSNHPQYTQESWSWDSPWRLPVDMPKMAERSSQLRLVFSKVPEGLLFFVCLLCLSFLHLSQGQWPKPHYLLCCLISLFLVPMSSSFFLEYTTSETEGKTYRNKPSPSWISWKTCFCISFLVPTESSTALASHRNSVQI